MKTSDLKISEADCRVLEVTRLWLERAVIGLNLCPFARAEYVNKRIAYRISRATQTGELLEDLSRSIEFLRSTNQAECETLLLIHPDTLTDFADYNQFLEEADDLVRQLGMEGIFQIASFHPKYQFAGTEIDDITNQTNRSPYPLLHLLREASVERAAGPKEAAEIVHRNLVTLRKMGQAGWDALAIPKY